MTAEGVQSFRPSRVQIVVGRIGLPTGSNGKAYANAVATPVRLGGDLLPDAPRGKDIVARITRSVNITGRVSSDVSDFIANRAVITSRILARIFVLAYEQASHW